jgi:hypothetical protein
MIKWKRLKTMAEVILRDHYEKPVKVVLSMSTELPNDIISAVRFQQDASSAVDIIFNAERCKDIEMIREALCHELAHVLDNSNEHGRTWERLRDQITNKMNLLEEKIISRINAIKKKGEHDDVYDHNQEEGDRTPREENVAGYQREE